MLLASFIALSGSGWLLRNYPQKGNSCNHFVYFFNSNSNSNCFGSIVNFVKEENDVIAEISVLQRDTQLFYSYDVSTFDSF